MEKAVIVSGVLAIIAIVGMVLYVNSSISGAVYYPYNNIYADDFYVRPSGVKMGVASGSVYLYTDSVINNVCGSTVDCHGLSTYTCCNHIGSECIIPPEEYREVGMCPGTHRGRCVCKEDYIAMLHEKYD